MADIRTKLITDLPLAEVLGGFEIFPVSQFGVAKQSSTFDVINFTKKQDYATWVYRASSNLATNDLSSKYIKLYNDPLIDGSNPEFFIGEAGYHSNTGEVSGLSGFQFSYHELTDRFVFVSYISSISTVRNLTAYYLDQNAYMYISNLSTSNTLSSRNIFVTDQITISANSNNDALFIVQNGQGNAIEVFDEINDLTPFVVTASGNVGIKTPNPVIDLTIAGSVSASQTLSARNIHVLDRVGIATSNPNETLTVSGSISARTVIFDGRLNSNRWFETYTNYSGASANEARVATFVNSNSSNIVNVNSTVNTTSANWNSVYSHWNVNSGLTFSARTYVTSNSANFSDSVSRYNSASGTYATYEYTNNGFLPLSGGTISSGTVRISGDSLFANNVTIFGRLCAFNFTVIQAETIPITASTLNVDGSGRFGGAFQVGGEVSFGDDLIVSGFTNVSGTILAENTITSRQSLQDLQSNSREWGSVYTRWRAVSSLDLNVRSFVNSNSSNTVNVNSKVNSASSNWDRSYTETSQTSANWNSAYSSWNVNSALDLNARTFVNSNSSNIVNVNSTVNTTSANWNSAYTTWNSNSSLDLNARTFVNSNSSNIVNVNSTVNTTSANWNSAYSSWNSNSSLDLAARSFVNSNSSNIVNVNSTVNTTSANWNSVYSHWNVNSGLTFSARTFVTSNSSNIINVNSKVNSASSNWDSAYGSFFSLSGAIGLGLTTFQESSARYNRVSTRVEVTSANWNSVYSTFQSNSAKYNSQRGVITIPLSGTSAITVPDHAVGFMDIYLNGIKLIPSDDFSETATLITLTEPTKYNQYKLEYVIYGAYNVPNTVAKTGDIMTGPLTVPSLTVNNSFAAKVLISDRQDTNAEGGEIQLRRSSDNSEKYFIDVFGTGNDPRLRIFEKTGSSPNFQYPERISILGGSGNVGIGTSNPSNAKLSIYQNSTPNYTLAVTNDTANTGDAFLINNLSTTANAAVIVNQGSGNALFISQRGTGYALVVEDQAVDPTPSFVIDSDGNIGMGTVPLDGSTRLEIKGKQSVPSASPDVRISSTNGGTLMVLDNAQVGNYGPLTQANDILVSYYGSGGVNTGGFTLAQWATSNKGIRITPAGNFGINTPNANQSLTVVGNISATGTIFGDGTGLKNLDLTRKFLSWPIKDNYVGNPQLYRINSFLSTDKRIYIAGNAYNYTTTFGQNEANRAYAYPGFQAMNIYGVDSAIPLNETVERFWIGSRYIFCQTNNDRVYAIGINHRGQLGVGNNNQILMWTLVANLPNISKISLYNGTQNTYFDDSYLHTLFVTSNNQLFATGYGFYGQLGLGGTANHNSPQRVNTGSILNKNIIEAYVVGDDLNAYGSSFCIDSDRNLHFTGYQVNGHGGLGDVVQRNSFVQVPTIKADKISCVGYNGEATTFVLDKQLGRLYAAGVNTSNQLGSVGANRSSFATVPTLASGVADFVSGTVRNAAAIAIMTDGSVRTWGRNEFGLLGHNGTTATATPTIPTNLGGRVFIKARIVSGYRSGEWPTSYLLDNQGDIWSSGYNGYGQRGYGTTTDNVLYTRMRKPSNVYFVDFETWGFNSGTGITGLDSEGDLWSCGYHNEHSGGLTITAQAMPVFQRCTIN